MQKLVDVSGQNQQAKDYSSAFGMPLEELRSRVGEDGRSATRFAISASTSMRDAVDLFMQTEAPADAETARVLGNQIKYALSTPEFNAIAPEFPYDTEGARFPMLDSLLQTSLPSLPVISAISDLQYILEMALENGTAGCKASSMVDAIDTKLQQWLGGVA